MTDVVDQWGILDPEKMAAQINQAFNDPAFNTQVEVNVSSIQLLACHSAPVVLVAAPGAGKMVVVDRYQIEYTHAGGNYVGTANNTKIFCGTFPLSLGAWLGAAVDTIVVGAAIVLTGARSLMENLPIVLTSIADPTGGSGTVKVSLSTRTVTL